MSEKIFINKSHRASLNIYLLLLHYELGNYEVLSYLAKSAQRYQIKNGNISKYDKLILSYFERKLSKITEVKEKEKTFINWKMNLSKFPKQSVLYNDTDALFDFISWIESKIQNRPFVQVVKEKRNMIKVHSD